ncbi:nuclear transport factor 2 family protein [Pseudomonas lalucatii]|uniref:Nuclear transport factor 2 family protein n=1 Tax=Pseudomonas lalucatii TaxID=1424203 RepID=A0ABS5Q0K4_9PSED|nr:nuclear transport factor 2 family protein [Pseudomonas lalucatii]MBS7661848.1 nuclear transport factor 2 family protein [Pseudomonas lalucatii]MBS7690604.1 nuclear transport factor 2 family protein [Pseudomonas lalucatii]MBS7726251.1 nuclear transport factor 2 family protein [Pseudomonas lalucatii]QVM88179.1 nuclear transport factor 2 family protein [Pseudomonas lalucatii]
MNTASLRHDQQQLEVRALLQSWAEAVQAKDVARILSHYAADVVAYDAILQLQFKGLEAYGAHWQACMEMCSGPGVFAVHEPTLLVGDELALAYYLCRCGGSDDQGQEQASWMRVTQGYQRRDGHWLIVHEHFSAPFDMQSGKALFDLKP